MAGFQTERAAAKFGRRRHIWLQQGLLGGFQTERSAVKFMSLVILEISSISFVRLISGNEGYVWPTLCREHCTHLHKVGPAVRAAVTARLNEPLHLARREHAQRRELARADSLADSLFVEPGKRLLLRVPLHD